MGNLVGWERLHLHVGPRGGFDDQARERTTAKAIVAVQQQDEVTGCRLDSQGRCCGGARSAGLADLAVWHRGKWSSN
jgi:hypothetical protein